MTAGEPSREAARQDFLEALKEGRRDDVRSALEDDPSLASRDHDGMSALLLAVFSGQEEMVELLEEHGATADLRDAAALGSVARLREAHARDDRASIDALGDHGWSALHLAAFLGRREATAWLLEEGADPAVVSGNREANTPLHAALAGREDEGVIRALLDAGADPGARAAQGVTPLHLAASRGNREVVDLLMANGARPEAMDDGRQPSALARERGHGEVAEYLEGVEGSDG